MMIVILNEVSVENRRTAQILSVQGNTSSVRNHQLKIRN